MPFKLNQNRRRHIPRARRQVTNWPAWPKLTDSYELYLFHLVVLGLMRTAFPPRATFGDAKLLLLAAFLVLSAVLAALVSRFYAEPLNRRIRPLGLSPPKVERTAT